MEYLLIFIILTFILIWIPVEWDVPEEIQPPKWLFSIVAGFSPVIGLSEANSAEWLLSFLKTSGFQSPSYQSNNVQKKQTDCVFIDYEGTNCIAKFHSLSNDISCEPPTANNAQFCIKFWDEKFRRLGMLNNKTCVVGQNVVDCAKPGKYRVLTSILYNDTNVEYKFSTETVEAKSFVKQTITKMKDNECLFIDPQTFSTIIPLDEKHSFLLSLNYNFTIFSSILYNGTNEKFLYKNEALSFFTNQTRICVCGHCVPLNNNLTPQSFNMDALLTIETTKDRKNITGASIRKMNHNAAVRNGTHKQLSKVSVIVTRFKEHENLARYYQQHGRFHCPSELSCPLEMFYILFDTTNPEYYVFRTNLLPFYMLTIALLYSVSNSDLIYIQRH